MSDRPELIPVNAVAEAIRPLLNGKYSAERVAQAAIDALSIGEWWGAPGDRRECPTCWTVWKAEAAGPLDIRWGREHPTQPEEAGR